MAAWQWAQRKEGRSGAIQPYDSVQASCDLHLGSIMPRLGTGMRPHAPHSKRPAPCGLMRRIPRDPHHAASCVAF
eukprot:351062-Chlamydomonas_euryale.AAC.8